MYIREMPVDEAMLNETYCTFCKENIPITGSKYIRLVNGRVIIKGKCSRCGLQLIKASIKPKSYALTLLAKKKKKKKRSKRSLRFI